MNNSKVNAIVEGFWQYLKKRKSLDLLPEILSELNRRKEQTSLTATVFTSEALQKDQQEKVIKIISSNFGIGAVEFEVDTNLIGGIKVKIGDEILDLSIQSKLDRLVESI